MRLARAALVLRTARWFVRVVAPEYQTIADRILRRAHRRYTSARKFATRARRHAKWKAA